VQVAKAEFHRRHEAKTAIEENHQTLLHVLEAARGEAAAKAAAKAAAAKTAAKAAKEEEAAAKEAATGAAAKGGEAEGEAATKEKAEAAEAETAEGAATAEGGAATARARMSLSIKALEEAEASLAREEEEEAAAEEDAGSTGCTFAKHNAGTQLVYPRAPRGCGASKLLKQEEAKKEAANGERGATKATAKAAKEAEGECGEENAKKKQALSDPLRETADMQFDGWSQVGNGWFEINVAEVGEHCLLAHLMATRDALAKIISNVFIPTGYHVQAEKNANLLLQSLFKPGKRNLLVLAALVCHEGAVVVVESTKRSTKTAYISMIVSHSKGNGNGEKVMVKLKERCAQAHIQTIHVSLQHCIQNVACFYMKLGFAQSEVETGLKELTYNIGGQEGVRLVGGVGSGSTGGTICHKACYSEDEDVPADEPEPNPTKEQYTDGGRGEAANSPWDDGSLLGLCLCCPQGHQLYCSQASQARGKGRCDGCNGEVAFDDNIAFCVRLSRLEHLDCNFYLCEGCCRLTEFHDAMSREGEVGATERVGPRNHPSATSPGRSNAKGRQDVEPCEVIVAEEVAQQPEAEADQTVQRATITKLSLDMTGVDVLSAHIAHIDDMGAHDKDDSPSDTSSSSSSDSEGESNSDGSDSEGESNEATTVEEPAEEHNLDLLVDSHNKSSEAGAANQTDIQQTDIQQPGSNTNPFDEACDSPSSDEACNTVSPFVGDSDEASDTTPAVDEEDLLGPSSSHTHSNSSTSWQQRGKRGKRCVILPVGRRKLRRRVGNDTFVPMTPSEARLVNLLLASQHELQAVGSIALPVSLRFDTAFVCDCDIRDCTKPFLDQLLDCLLQCPKLRHASLQRTCRVWSNDQVNKLCRLICRSLMTVNLGEIDFTQPQLVSLYSAIYDSNLGAAYFGEQTWLIEIGLKCEFFKPATIKLLRRNRAKPAFERFMLALTTKYANYVSGHLFWYNPFGGFWGVIVKMICLEERDGFYVGFQQMRVALTPHDRKLVALSRRTMLFCEQRAAKAALQSAQADKGSASGVASSGVEAQGKVAELESKLGELEGKLKEEVAKAEAKLEAKRQKLRRQRRKQQQPRQQKGKQPRSQKQPRWMRKMC
jgi:hypothetical protein